jgi:mannose-6-phosphate isomerase-like protein (cupin superfamily)
MVDPKPFGRIESVTEIDLDVKNRDKWRAAGGSGMARDDAAGAYAKGQHDQRPWGDWTVLDAAPGWCVKRIRVASGGVLSLQYHHYRGEDWVVVAGTARVTRDGEVFDLRPGERTHIAPHQVHRVANPGEADLVFIEIQTGEDPREDDIVRVEDQYGRS